MRCACGASERAGGPARQPWLDRHGGRRAALACGPRSGLGGRKATMRVACECPDLLQQPALHAAAPAGAQRGGRRQWRDGRRWQPSRVVGREGCKEGGWGEGTVPIGSPSERIRSRLVGCNAGPRRGVPSSPCQEELPTRAEPGRSDPGCGILGALWQVGRGAVI